MKRGPDQQPSAEGRDPALDLLRNLSPKVTLTPAAKRRIGAVLAGSPAKRYHPWSIAVPAAAALAVVLLVALRHRTQAPAVAMGRQEIVVPSCGLSRVVNDSLHYRGAFVGPAQVSVDADGLVSLGSGRAVLTTGAREAFVSAGRTRIRVQPNSLVDIVVHFGGVRVAAFVGSAQVVSEFARTVVDQGVVWNDGALGRVTEDAARAAREIADERVGQPSLCVVPATSEQPKPSVSNEALQTAPAPLVVAAPRIVTPTAIRRSGAHEQQGVKGDSLDAPERSPEPVGVPALQEAPATASPTEAAFVANAIRQLRQQHDPRLALALLDDLQLSHPNGEFALEITILRVEALRQLGDHRKALALLDAVSLPNVPRGAQLLSLRAELRSEEGRYAEAASDYTNLLSHGEVSEEALVGRAACRFKLGDDRGARNDLEEYLLKYPNGSHASDAKRAVAR